MIEVISNGLYMVNGIPYKIEDEGRYINVLNTNSKCYVFTLKYVKYPNPADIKHKIETKELMSKIIELFVKMEDKDGY